MADKRRFLMAADTARGLGTETPVVAGVSFSSD
jgi:hypothetical protein